LHHLLVSDPTLLTTIEVRVVRNSVLSHGADESFGQRVIESCLRDVHRPVPAAELILTVAIGLGAAIVASYLLRSPALTPGRLPAIEVSVVATRPRQRVDRTGTSED